MLLLVNSLISFTLEALHDPLNTHHIFILYLAWPKKSVFQTSEIISNRCMKVNEDSLLID